MIVGLVGKKRSGKTTAAEVFQNYMYSKVSLAEGIKEATKSIFLLNDEQVYGEKKEEIVPYLNTTPRKLMQVVGTELFQYDIYEYIPELEEAIPKRELWIRMFEQKYEMYVRKYRKTPKIVIDDVRFMHEVNVLRSMGAVIIKIIRPGLESKDTHASELEVGEIEPNYKIINGGTIRQLKNKIVNLIHNEREISL